MEAETDTLTLGLVQMTSRPLREDNIPLVRELLADARGCDLVVFPEYVLSLGDNDAVARAARTEQETDAQLGALAAEHHGAVLFGGVPVIQGAGRRNAALAYNACGQRLARYDKIHLFQLGSCKGAGIDETAVFEHGGSPVSMSFQGWSIGLSICYDIRFPELFRRLPPVDLILNPAAFVQKTGQAHWHLLQRARAVENQCYVAAPAQCGINTQVRVPKYGHTLLVDPWGEVLLDAGPTATGVFKTTLEHGKIQEVRAFLPALENRRM